MILSFLSEKAWVDLQVLVGLRAASYSFSYAFLFRFSLLNSYSELWIFRLLMRASTVSRF